MSIVLIGGQSSLGGIDGGGAGPMPQFSINREEITTGDGTYINSKFTININGYAVPLSQGNITIKGNSQEVIQALATQYISFNVDGDNRLEISPYGGMPNSIVFDDARLISMDLPEQDEETSGTRYLEYSFTFEAYDDASVTRNSGASEIEKPTYKLASAEESWDLSPNDNQIVYKDADIQDDSKQFKTFTLTHTITAVGIKKYINDAVLDPETGHAWSQACEWVKDRLSMTTLNNGTPDLPVTKDLMGNDQEIAAVFHPFYMNKNSTGTVVDLKTEPYKARNKTRSITSDISTGSYSITDTWLLSLADIKAFHEIDISIDNSIEQANVVVTANGTVTGLTERDIDVHSDDKYVNALEEYNKFFENASDILQSKIAIAASAVYNDFISAGYKTGTILPYAINHSETHNKIAGTINWSMSFTDEEVLVPGAISQNVQFSYENDQDITYEHDNISVIGVVRNGPFLYDPNTTNEKKLKISVDIVMASDARSSKPDGQSAYDLPPMIWWHNAPRITAKTESWNPKSGAYNMSIEYTYV